MTSAPRSVVVSVLFFPMGLLYYSSANGADYTISARNPTTTSAVGASSYIAGIILMYVKVIVR